LAGNGLVKRKYDTTTIFCLKADAEVTEKCPVKISNRSASG
jgi:hypothetical protein